MTEPIHVISLGAGVQSSTMALMAAHGEITPMPKCAIFADTQDEPEEVYYWLDKLEKLLPFPLVRVSRRFHLLRIRFDPLTSVRRKKTRKYFDRLNKFFVGGGSSPNKSPSVRHPLVK